MKVTLNLTVTNFEKGKNVVPGKNARLGLAMTLWQKRHWLLQRFHSRRKIFLLRSVLTVYIIQSFQKFFVSPFFKFSPPIRTAICK